MANTLKALNSLADQVPGMNQKALQQVQAARDISLQRQLGAAPTGQPVTQQAQQTATQQAMQAGQDIVAQRQQASAKAQQLQQASLQQRQQQGQQALAQKKLAQDAQLETQRNQQLQQLRKEELASRKTILESDIEAAESLQDLGILLNNDVQMATIKQREDLSRIGIDVKDKLITSRLAFKEDERGRKFTNARQMADYIASSAQTRQQFNQKMSSMLNANKKHNAVLKQSVAQIEAAIERGYINQKGDLDFEAKKNLATYRNELQAATKRAETRAKNSQAMTSAFGSVLGAGIGGYVGGPTGAVAGAQLGSAASTALGSIF